MEASYFPGSSIDLQFEMYVDNVRDNSKLEIITFLAPDSENASFDENRIWDIISSGDHTNGQEYSWSYTMVQKESNVLSVFASIVVIPLFGRA